MNPTSSTKKGNFYFAITGYEGTWNFTLDSSENANKFFKALEQKKKIQLSLTASGTEYFYSGSLPSTFGFDSTPSEQFEGKYFIYAENDGGGEKFGIILQTTDDGLKKHKIGEIVEGTTPLNVLDDIIGTIGNQKTGKFTFSYDAEPEESQNPEEPQNPNESVEGCNSLILIFLIICWLLCICCCLFAIRS